VMRRDRWRPDGRITVPVSYGRPGRGAYDTKAPVRGHRCRYVNPAGRKFQFTADASPNPDLAPGAILGGIEVFSQVEEDTRSQCLLFCVAEQELRERVLADVAWPQGILNGLPDGIGTAYKANRCRAR